MKAREILVEEANVQWIDSPVTVSPALLECVSVWTAAHSASRLDLRGHPWTVLGPARAVQSRGHVPGHELPLPR
jgi:hypothetical protein